MGHALRTLDRNRHAMSDELAPRPTEKKPLSRRVADEAVERAFGDRVPDDLKRVAADRIAPWAEKLVRALDDFLKIPGTDFGIGLDPIVGFVVPGAGDAITSTGSVALLFLALKERVPTIALLRMVMNIFIDTLVGVVPILGDVFDMFFRSNRRNLDIIKKYRRDPEAKPSTSDYVIVFGGVALAILNVVLPIVVAATIGASVVAAIWALVSGTG